MITNRFKEKNIVIAAVLTLAIFCVNASPASAVAIAMGASDRWRAEAVEDSVSLGTTFTESYEVPAPSSGGSSSASEVVKYLPDKGLCPNGVLAVFEKQRVDGSTGIIRECVDASAGPSGPEFVVVRGSDVASLIVDGSGAWRQPPGPQARIDTPVIAYSSGDSVTLTTTVAGIGVTVVATPVSYRWDWGDGTSTTTTDPGAPYPDHTVSHDYRGTRKDVVITVTTTWEATFTPDGGQTQPVSGAITTTSSATPFDLVRTVTYLTDDAEEAQGR